MPAPADDWGAVEIANERIAPGEVRRFTWQGQSSLPQVVLSGPALFHIGEIR